jgi:hypothetical protein
MDKIKKVYIDSRYKSNDSVSNSDFKFELKEALDLPDNTVCYIDDISIPHTWYTIEENLNNTLYIVTTQLDPGVTPTWYHALALEIPAGNYTGSTLAAALQTELNIAEPDHSFVCVYNTASGSITIESTYIQLFYILSDYQISTATYSFAISWKDRIGNNVPFDFYNLKSLNEVIRNENNNEYHPLQVQGVSEHTTPFLDLLTVHNIYIHSNNLGHYNTIGVRGENTIIKKTPVSSGFGYMILDSVVAPHDKIDVSRQTIKTLNFSFKNVHGNVIDLHGANVSFSMIFVTTD